MIKAIFWDLDDTILDFPSAEKAAIRKLFTEYDLGECTEDMLSRYVVINKGYWQALERGEMPRDVIMVARFEDFFEEYGLRTDIAAEFNLKYQSALGDTIVFHDRADKLVAKLHETHKQYLVSNGSSIAQAKKLKNAGIKEFFDDIFISEEVGAEKPGTVIFEKAIAKAQQDLGPLQKNEILMIGDSLTSDMQGGINAGIVTCWYNPSKAPKPDTLDLDYVISDLHAVEDILKAHN